MKLTLLSITPHPEKHIEYCARSCYHSMDKMDEDSYLRILPPLFKKHHLSVFEHASASFLIEEISRVTSHQIVRHRLAAFSQQSQRLVSEDEFRFVTPPAIQKNPELRQYFENKMQELAEDYQFLISKGISKEDARFLLPNATQTSLTMTANFREWLHIINLRVSEEAQWEIRTVLIGIWKILYQKAPTIFNLSYFEQFSNDFSIKRRIFYEEIQV